MREPLWQLILALTSPPPLACRTVAVTGRRASNASPGSGALHGSAEHHLDAFGRLRLCITGITVDPQILRQGKLVNLEVQVVRRSQRHPPQRGGFVVLHSALPSQDREVVQLPELGRPMEERADVPYLERRDPQLFLQLTPERGLGAFPRLDVATRKGDGARHHPLCGLPLLCQDRRLLKDEGRDTLERLSVLPHAAPSLTPVPSNVRVERRAASWRVRSPTRC